MLASTFMQALTQHWFNGAKPQSFARQTLLLNKYQQHDAKSILFNAGAHLPLQHPRSHLMIGNKRCALQHFTRGWTRIVFSEPVFDVRALVSETTHSQTIAGCEKHSECMAQENLREAVCCNYRIVVYFHEERPELLREKQAGVHMRGLNHCKRAAAMKQIKLI